MKKEDLVTALQKTLREGINLGSLPIVVGGDVVDHLAPFMGKTAAQAVGSVHQVLKKIRVAQIFNNRGLGLPNLWVSFSLSTAAAWLINRTNQTGDATRVVREFYKFLRTNAADVLAVTALVGFQLTEKVKLDENSSLIPFAELPDSKIKKQLSEIRPPLVGMMTRGAFKQPSAAIVLRFRVQPVLIKHDERRDIVNTDLLGGYSSKRYGELSLEINELCRLLTLIGPSSSTPIISWMQIEPSNPMSAMAQGFSSPMHEIDPYPPLDRKGDVPKIEAKNVTNLISAYRSLSKGRKDAIHIPLDRLNLAMRRQKIEDQAIELGIALEALLLNDVGSSGELSFRLRLRGALLHPGTIDDRVHVHDLLNDMYDLRSKAVHGNKLKINDNYQGQTMKTADRLWEGMELCALLIRTIIERKKQPDWKKLVLGIK